MSSADTPKGSADRVEELREMSDYYLGQQREVYRGFARLAYDAGDTEAQARFAAEGKAITSEWNRRCAEREAQAEALTYLESVVREHLDPESECPPDSVRDAASKIQRLETAKASLEELVDCRCDELRKAQAELEAERARAEAAEARVAELEAGSDGEDLGALSEEKPWLARSEVAPSGAQGEGGAS